MKKVSLLFVCVLAFFCVACDLGADDIPRNMELDSISVEVIDSYFNLNSSFDYDKILLLGHYSDGSTQIEDASLAMYNGFDSSKKNTDLIVTVKYRGKEADFHITIGEVRQEEIWIVNYPKKIIYPQGTNLTNNLDLDGIEVHAKLENGATRVLGNNEYAYSVIHLGEVNVVNIYSIENTSVTTHFFVWTIGDGIVTGVDVDKSTNNRKYNIGDTIDFKNKKVSVKVGENEITISDGEWFAEKRIVNENDIQTIVKKDYVSFWRGLFDWFFHNTYKRTTLYYEFPINCLINDYNFELEFPITYKELQTVKIETTPSNPELYKGNTKRFDNTSFCKFSRVYGEGAVETNEITPDEYNDLRYSAKDEGFDKALSLETEFKFEDFGLQTVYFYYKPEDSEGKEFKCSYNFLVHDAKMEGLRASWKNNITPDALDITKEWDKDTIKNVLQETLIVEGIYSDETYFTIENNSWNITSLDLPNFGTDEYGPKNGKIQIHYIGDRGIEYVTKDPILVPFIKPQPSSSS